MKEEFCQKCGRKLIESKLGYYCPSCHTTINLNDIKLTECEYCQQQDEEWVDEWFTSGLVHFENDENIASITIADATGIGDEAWFYIYDTDTNEFVGRVGEKSQTEDHCLICGHPLSVSNDRTIFCEHCKLQEKVENLKLIILKMSNGNAKKPYWKLDLFWDEQDKDYNFCIRTSQYGIFYDKHISKEKLIEIMNKHNNSLDRMYDAQNHLYIGDEKNDFEK